MKKLSLLTLILVLLLTIVPVSAAGNEILFGTPVIDGQIDEMYNQSWTWSFDHTTVNYGEVTEDESATVYALYDTDNLYVAVKVTSAKNGNSGNDAAIEANVGDHPWPWDQMDGVEIRYTDASGNTYALWGDYMNRMVSNYNLYSGEYSYKAVALDDSSYSIEFVIPFVNNEGAGSVLQLGVQVDNFDDAYCCSFNGGGAQELTLSANEVSLPESETKAPVEETPAEVVDSTVAEVVETAPKTADATLVIAAVSALLGSAAYSILKKK